MLSCMSRIATKLAGAGSGDRLYKRRAGVLSKEAPRRRIGADLMNQASPKTTGGL